MHLPTIVDPCCSYFINLKILEQKRASTLPFSLPFCLQPGAFALRTTLHSVLFIFPTLLCGDLDNAMIMT